VHVSVRYEAREIVENVMDPFREGLIHRVRDRE